MKLVAGEIDIEGTKHLRARLAPVTLADFDLGAYRETHDRVFSEGVYAEINRILYSLPIPLRYYTRGKLIQAVRDAAKDGQHIGADTVRSAWEQLGSYMATGGYMATGRRA